MKKLTLALVALMLATSAGAAPVVIEQQVAPQQSGGIWSAIGSLIGWVLFLCLLAGAVALRYWLGRTMYRKFKETKMQDAPFPFSPMSFFMSVQRAYCARDVQVLQRTLGPDVIDIVLNKLPEKDMPCNVVASYEVLDHQRDVISVHYKGHDNIDDKPINEVWHFVQLGSQWVLNGIEPIGD